MGRQCSKQAIAWFLTWLATSRGAMSHAAYAPQVYSTSGTIIGHQAPDRPDTFEFLGIKYGQAPIGELRFAPPERYIAPAHNLYNASTWNADCPANIAPETTFPDFTNNGLKIINEFTGRLGNQQDEDCLALNIWTKSTSETHPHNTKKPVFAFFHGGRFTIPGPHSPFYNGQYLADNEDVVVVTINYRLGIFGFSGAPGIEQNAGLRDQRSAIEWLRDNIAGFGGDPSRIIIFGQSAGGASVDYWAYAYEKDPIVAGIISHSGTALSFLPNTPEYSRSLYNNVTTTLGCVNTTDKDTLSCLRTQPVRALLAAARNVPALPTLALAQATFHPTVDNTTVFADYASLGKCGAFAKIPYLAGNNDYEAGTYRISAFNANITLSPARWELFNERAFTCPTKYAADFRVAHGVPTWRYRYMGDYENLRLYDSWGEYPGSGAYHGVELSELFGTAQNVSGEVSSAEQQRFSRYMQGAWAAFGRDPWRGLTEECGWLSYNESSESLVKLAPGGGGGVLREIVDPGVYDGRCPRVEDNDPMPGRGAF